MNFFLYFFNLIRSSDKTKNEMIEKNIAKHSDITGENQDYQTIEYKIQQKNTESEIKNYESKSNIDKNDLKFILNTLRKDVKFHNLVERIFIHKPAEKKFDEENPLNSENKDYDSIYNSIITDSSEEVENKKKFSVLFQLFKDKYDDYREKRSFFKKALKEFNDIVEINIKLVNNNKKLERTQQELDNYIKKIVIHNEAYNKSFNELKSHVNNLSDEDEKILDSYIGCDLDDDSLYKAIVKYESLVNKWNDLIKRQNTLSN